MIHRPIPCTQVTVKIHERSGYRSGLHVPSSSAFSLTPWTPLLTHSPSLTTVRGLCCLLGVLFLSPVSAADPIRLTADATAPPPAETVSDKSTLPKPAWYLQSTVAIASESDFGPALAFYYERPDQRTNLVNLGVGRHLADSLFGWPAEVVAYGGIQHFGERNFQPDAIGGTAYIKAYRQFRIGKRQFPLRVGLGEGLSYASRIPIVEVEDFLPQTSAKLTNYLEWTLQTSLNHLLGHEGRRFSAGIKDIYIGYSVFHRSTVFGLFASKGGGVNYMGFGVELVLD